MRALDEVDKLVELLQAMDGLLVLQVQDFCQGRLARGGGQVEGQHQLDEEGRGSFEELLLK